MTPTSERLVHHVAVVLCAASLIFLGTISWAIAFVPRPATLDQRLNERMKEINEIGTGLDQIGARLDKMAHN